MPQRKPSSFRRIAYAALCAFIGASAVDSQVTVETMTLADIGYVEAEPVLLSGYGMVTGLAGDGDGCILAFTDSTLAASYRRMGIIDGGARIKARDCAAVFVTAEVPGGSCVGSRLHVNVVALGDARRLAGGFLEQLTLTSRDHRLSVTASGPVGSTQTGNTSLSPHSGRIDDGATLRQTIFLSRTPDLEMNITVPGNDGELLCAIVDRINARFGEVAIPAAPERITICLPDAYINADERLRFAIELGEMSVGPPKPLWLADDESLSQQIEEGSSSERPR